MSEFMELRPIQEHELEAALELEQRCYPPEAAATLGGFVHRFQKYGPFFWSAWSGERLIGIANGIRTDQTSCGDEMKGEQMDDGSGSGFCVLTVAVDPEWRGRGIGTRLLRMLVSQCEAYGLQRIILMCEKHLIPFYEAEGFILHGVSSSAHGGIEWYEMSRSLHKMEHLTE